MIQRFIGLPLLLTHSNRTLADDSMQNDSPQAQTVQQLVDYVRGLAVIDPEQSIPLEESLLETGVLDSFGIVEMITFVECEFDLAIPQKDMNKTNLGSIRKMADYVERRRAA